MSSVDASSATYSPQAPGRVLATRPREGFRYWPGQFTPELVMVSLRTVRLANLPGAWLNDGWDGRRHTAGERWSRSSKSSFGRPALVYSRQPAVSIPHH